MGGEAVQTPKENVLKRVRVSLTLITIITLGVWGVEMLGMYLKWWHSFGHIGPGLPTGLTLFYGSMGVVWIYSRFDKKMFWKEQ
jgi:hypothetical protein